MRPPVRVIRDRYLHTSVLQETDHGLYTLFAASAAPSPKTNTPSSGRATPASARRLSLWYFLMAAFRVPRPRVAHLGREGPIWRPSCSIISLSSIRRTWFIVRSPSWTCLSSMLEAAILMVHASHRKRVV